MKLMRDLAAGDTVIVRSKLATVTRVYGETCERNKIHFEAVTNDSEHHMCADKMAPQIEED